MSEPKTIKINEVEYVRADSVKRAFLPKQDGNEAYPYEIGKNSKMIVSLSRHKYKTQVAGI